MFYSLSHIELCSSQEDLEILPTFIPKDYDFNKLEFTQPEGASKQVTNFLAKGFLKRFKRSFSVKIQPPLWLKHTMRIIK